MNLVNVYYTLYYNAQYLNNYMRTQRTTAILPTPARLPSAATRKTK